MIIHEGSYLEFISSDSNRLHLCRPPGQLGEARQNQTESEWGPGSCDSARLQNQASISDRLLSPLCVGSRPLLGPGQGMNILVGLLCPPCLFPISRSLGLRAAAVPGLYSGSHTSLHEPLQPPQQGVLLVPPDPLLQRVTGNPQSLGRRPRPFSPNPGRFPLTGTTQLVPSFCLLLVCLANSLPWQVHQEAIILLKPGA